MAQVIRSNGASTKKEMPKKAAKPAAKKAAKPKVSAKPKKEKPAKAAKSTVKKPRLMSRKLNPKELKVAQFLVKHKTATLEEMAEVFPKKGTASRSKGNSWVRNSLRKLLVLKIAKKADRGTYHALVTKIPAECLGEEKAETAAVAKPKKARPKKVKEAKAEEPNGVPEAPAPDHAVEQQAE